MYLKASSIKSRNRKSIIDLTGESLTPKVVSFTQKVDRDDIRDTQLKIEIYCQISVPNYLKNKNNKKAELLSILNDPPIVDASSPNKTARIEIMLNENATPAARLCSLGIH